MMRKTLSIFAVAFLLVLFCSTDVLAADKLSDVMKSYMDGGKWCWFCPLFVGIFKGIDNIATNIVVELADTFLQLLALGMLFWIAFYVGKAFMSMQPINMGQFFKDFFGSVGRTIIAAILITTMFSIFQYLLNPFLSMSLGLSDQILTAGSFSGAIKKATQVSATQNGGIAESALETPECDKSWGSDNNRVFDKATCQSLEVSLRSMSAALVGNMAVGSFLSTSAIGTFAFWKWKLDMFAIGLLIIIANFFILIAFPFKLIDALVRLGFVCTLMPLFIVLWVFQSTRQYTLKAWQMFLGSCMTFVFMAVILVLILSILTYTLPQGEDLNKMLTLLNQGKAEEGFKFMDLSGSQIFVTVAVCFIGYSILGTAETFAQAFGGITPGIGAGGRLEGAATATASKAGKVGGRVAGKVGGAAAKVGKWAAVAAGGAIAAGARKGGNKLWDKATENKKIAQAFAAPGNAKNDAVSFMNRSGELVRAIKDKNGMLERKEVTGKNGKTRVYDAKNNLLGTKQQLKGGGYIIRNADNRTVESKTRDPKTGDWITNRYGFDAAGKQFLKSQTTLSATKGPNGKLTETTIDHITGKKSVATGAEGMKNSLERSKVMNNGGEFTKFNKERVEQMKKGADGKWDEKNTEHLHDATYKHDVFGNTVLTETKDKDGLTTRSFIYANGAREQIIDENGIKFDDRVRDFNGNKTSQMELMNNTNSRPNEGPKPDGDGKPDEGPKPDGDGKPNEGPKPNGDGKPNGGLRLRPIRDSKPNNGSRPQPTMEELEMALKRRNNEVEVSTPNMGGTPAPTPTPASTPAPTPAPTPTPAPAPAPEGGNNTVVGNTGAATGNSTPNNIGGGSGSARPVPSAPQSGMGGDKGDKRPPEPTTPPPAGTPFVGSGAKDALDEAKRQGQKADQVASQVQGLTAQVNKLQQEIGKKDKKS